MPLLATSSNDTYRIKKSLTREDSGQNPWQHQSITGGFVQTTGTANIPGTYSTTLTTSNATYTTANTITTN